MLIERR